MFTALLRQVSNQVGECELQADRLRSPSGVSGVMAVAMAVGATLNAVLMRFLWMADGAGFV